MARVLTLLLLGSLITTLSGCIGAPASSPSTWPIDVNGTWTGGNVTGTRTVTLTLHQTGTNVTGTITGGGALDGPTQATIEGHTIQFVTRAGVAPRLSIQGDFMRGNVDGVPFQLVRLGPPQTPR